MIFSAITIGASGESGVTKRARKCTWHHPPMAHLHHRNPRSESCPSFYDDCADDGLNEYGVMGCEKACFEYQSDCYFDNESEFYGVIISAVIVLIGTAVFIRTKCLYCCTCRKRAVRD